MIQGGGTFGPLGALAGNASAKTLEQGGNLLKHLASGAITSGAGELAGAIGAQHRSGALDPITHKALHGVLAMASTLGQRALQGEALDWNQVATTAGVTMAGESLASNAGEDLSKEEKEGLLAGLRTLAATGLALEGADASHITASDEALHTALRYNFVGAAAPAVLHCVGRGLAWLGASWIVGQAVEPLLTEKKPEENKEGKKDKPSKRREKPQEKTQKEIIAEREARGEKPMTQEEILDVRKGKQAPVKDYGTDDAKKEVKDIVGQTGVEQEQHHIWTQKDSDAFKKRGNDVKNKVIVILPKPVHQAEGGKSIHGDNTTKTTPDCPRESLAQGVTNTRKGMQEAGYDTKETAEALLKGIGRLKEDNPGFFDTK